MPSSVKGLLLAALVITPTVAGAQPPRRDTTRAALDSVVVTAERSATSIAGSAAAVTRLSGSDIARIPHATLADVLRTVPGVAVADFEGLGFDPQLMVRGFYGGGEAEYVVVLLNGRPLNLIHTGRAIWESLPSDASIEAIEVVRGGASALYGDAAIGGVINIITHGQQSREPTGGLRIAGGSHGLSHISSAASGASSGGTGSLSIGRDDTDGFRNRGQRTSSHFRIRMAPVDNASGHFAMSYFTQSRASDDPGPTTDDILAVDRTGTDVLFGFDRANDRNHEIGLDGSRQLGARAGFSWYATTGWRSMTTVRTIALMPGFGDTKQRDAKLRSTIGSAQIDAGRGLLPLDGLLTVGAEYSTGSAESRYYNVATGNREAYASSNGGRGPLSSSADAGRTSAAAFAQLALNPVPRVRVTLGGRFDRIDDQLDQLSPSASTASTQHEAFSPKAGISVRYLDRGSTTGNVYVTAGRSFKAPTLDQLYDQRTYPVPFPPFELQSSNPSLKPQTGTNVEAGAYHNAALTPALFLSLSMSVYEMQMEDEIDFDVATLSYGNIAESRHRGAELGVRVAGPRLSSGFLSYTLQDATAEAGDNAGKQLKAIPKHTFSAGAGVAPHERVETSAVLTRFGEAFIDDANTRTLAAYARLDARAGFRVSAYQVFGEVRNLLGAEYNSTGYLDPSGSGAAYYYPAAGRVLVIGVQTAR